ncbi:cytochrome c [Jannaschia pagri]|uniref:Cytochrome c n=2 Tax=Jannaschia TaxID=188905 RepID=A0ABQ4NIT1_9RHOB|nr:cytochrome c [Jannaschia sp. AI_62]GIT89576.1 cytochrome c [Jannaschia sp. AI_61]GIT94316.1 cytochrome c [Jannaschia sp. AI_62]
MRVSVLFLLLAGCVSYGPSEWDISAERGARLYDRMCASCHGADGTGGLGPDLTQLSARNGGTFPDEFVMGTIDGLDRHGDADAVMPEFGAEGLGETVIIEHDGFGTPVPADLLALTAYVESLQR